MQVGAEHVDAHLALGGVVVGEVGKRVDPGESYGRALVAELVGGRLEAIGEQALIVAVAVALLQAMATVVQRERDNGPRARSDGERDLEDVGERLPIIDRSLGADADLRRDAEQPGEQPEDDRHGHGDEHQRNKDRQPRGTQPRGQPLAQRGPVRATHAKWHTSAQRPQATRRADAQLLRHSHANKANRRIAVDGYVDSRQTLATCAQRRLRRAL